MIKTEKKGLIEKSFREVVVFVLYTVDLQKFGYQKSRFFNFLVQISRAYFLHWCACPLYCFYELLLVARWCCIPKHHVWLIFILTSNPANVSYYSPHYTIHLFCVSQYRINKEDFVKCKHHALLIAEKVEISKKLDNNISV